MTIKLYYTPGSCSLSPHIALREAELDFELVQVDLAAKKLKQDESSYFAINPKGYVPALVVDKTTLITEGAVIVAYIADQKPEKGLAPKHGTLERIRFKEWLHFTATELHKGFGPINNAKASDELKQFYKTRLFSRFEFVERSLEGKQFLLGEQFSVADGYLYYVLRSLKKLDAAQLDKWTHLKAFFARVEGRSAVQAALKAENLL